MNSITVARNNKGTWMATYSGPYADLVKSMFGTTTLQTGFSDLADADEVLLAMELMNPEFYVVVTN